VALPFSPPFGLGERRVQLWVVDLERSDPSPPLCGVRRGGDMRSRAAKNSCSWIFSRSQGGLMGEAATFRSSPVIGLKASLGIPPAINAGVAPSSELPTLMWASRKARGVPGSSVSSHKLTFASSAASGLTSTP